MMGLVTCRRNTKGASLFSLPCEDPTGRSRTSQVLTGHVGQLIWVSSLENCNEGPFLLLFKPPVPRYLLWQAQMSKTNIIS